MASIVDHIKKSPHRVRLERLLRGTLPKLSGTVLDIGSKNRRYDSLLRDIPVAIDIIENKEKNIQRGDVQLLPFANESFDNVLCIEVLEYVAQPTQAFDEMYRVLRHGGTLVLSVPFLFKMHDDRYRYTSMRLRELLGSFNIVSLDVVGGSYTAVLTLWWGKVKSIRFALLRYAGTLLLLLLKLFLVPVRSSSESYASGYFVIAKKQ